MVGTTLGVAVLFGVLITNGAISRALDQLAEQNVDTVVLDAPGAYGATVPAAALLRAVALPDVAQASGNVWFRGQAGADHEEVWINASQTVAGPAAGKQGATDGPPMASTGEAPKPDANEVALGAGIATRLGVGVGDRFTLETPTGPAELTVTRRFDGAENLVHTSIETARRLGGIAPDAFGNIAVGLADGVDARQWITTNEAALGADVTARAGFGDVDRGAVTVLQNAFFSVGLLAVFVGGFLLFLTMTMTVAERNRTWGVLRAVGAPRRAVVRAVLVESVVVGAVATMFGLVLGFVLGAGLLRLTTTMYGVTNAKATPTGGAVLTAVLIGLIVPPLAALRPAWRAASAEPVEAMRDLHHDDSTIGRGWMFGLPMLLLGFAMTMRNGRSGVDLAVLLVLFGSVLLVPPVLAPVVRIVSRVTTWIAPGLGAAAVGHLVKERRRSAYTLALVMIVLAMILAMGSMQTSLLHALDEGWRVRFGTDVNVFSSTPMPAAVRQQLAALPHVDGTTETSFGRLQITAPVASDGEVLIIDPDSFFSIQGLPWAEGDEDSARAALNAGDAILVPQVVTTKFGLGVGDSLTVDTPSGAHELRIAGVFATPQRGIQAITGFNDGRKYFGATEPTAVALRAADGTSPEALRDEVKASLSNTSAYFVNTTSEDMQQGINQIRNTFRPFVAVVFVAGVVGALGLANTLLMSLIRRTRELGVLRAIGMSRRDLSAMVVVEALTMTLVAFVLASGLGWVLAYAMLKSSGNALGFVVDFVPPLRLLPSTLIVTVVLAALAAITPVRRVAKLDPVVALRFE